MALQKNNLATIQARFPDSRLTAFGDSAALSERLLGLIRAGVKTATCSALRDYTDEDPPRAGEVFVVLDHDGAPALVIGIDDVTIQTCDALDETFALAEGEGDFADWRAGHIDFFARNGGWSPDMMIVCERFHLIADLATDAARQ